MSEKQILSQLSRDMETGSDKLRAELKNLEIQEAIQDLDWKVSQLEMELRQGEKSD